jgi:hypothetical protein
MTEHDELRDPPRLLEDATSDEDLRVLLEEARELSPPALPIEIRARVGEALRMRAPSRPLATRGPWLALAAGLALAAIALLVWLGREPETHTPALPPIVGDTDAAVPADAGLDAPIDAGPIEPREHVPWLEVNGNGCGLDVRVSLVELDDDVVSVAIVLEEVEPDDLATGLDASCSGSLVRELDARLFREAAAIPSSLTLPLSFGAPELTCGRTYAISACVRDGLGRLAPRRDAMADVRSTRNIDENRFVGEIETPSGPARASDLAPGHVVTGFFFQTTPAWTTPGPVTPTFVDAPVRRITERSREGENRETTIELEAGRSISLHADTRVWVAGAANDWVVASRLAPGDTVLVRAPDEADLVGGLPPSPRGVVEARVRAVHTVDHAAAAEVPHRWPALWTLDVGFPHTYFVDGLLVHDDGATEEGSSAHTVAAPRPHEPIRAMPEPSWDCSLSSELVVETLTPDVASVAIVYAPHRGRDGARRTIDCEDGPVGTELPRSLLESIPPSPDGARRLSVQVPGWDEAGQDWHAVSDDVDASRPTPRSVECSSAYDVLACVRGSDGTLARLPGGEGRWALTGPACFARGTEVTTREGARTIESLRVGEHVTSRDPETGEVREVEVRALVPRGTRPIRALELEGGRVLRTTDEHPLFDPRVRAFRQARTIVAGDHLLDAEGHEVEVLRVGPAVGAPVYDLSVEAPHTFFAEGVLAHNY